MSQHSAAQIIFHIIRNFQPIFIGFESIDDIFQRLCMQIHLTTPLISESTSALFQLELVGGRMVHFKHRLSNLEEFKLTKLYCLTQGNTP
jgi:hypothetical protein